MNYIKKNSDRQRAAISSKIVYILTSGALGAGR